MAKKPGGRFSSTVVPPSRSAERLGHPEGQFPARRCSWVACEEAAASLASARRPAPPPCDTILPRSPALPARTLMRML